MWQVAILLVIWATPASALLLGIARTRPIRIAVGLLLAGALAFLASVAGHAIYGPGLPTDIEAWVLYGPTVVVLCSVAWLADRLWLRVRTHSLLELADSEAAPSATGVWRPRTNGLVLAAFILWSMCCGWCATGWRAEFIDLRVSSPYPSLVLPLPDGLTLVEEKRGCGSVSCSYTFLIGTPEYASVPELTDRFWAHLVGEKGFERLQPDAGCTTPGWLYRYEMCVVVDTLPSSRMLVVRLTGDLGLRD